MQDGLTISLVIPTHNEEVGLRAVLDTLPGVVDELVVVDWQSQDGTLELARRAGATVIVEPRRGYGRAYLTGVPQAQGDIVVTMDADGTYPTQGIPRLVRALLDRDLAFISGSRFPLQDPLSMARTNKLGNRLLTRAANRMFGLQLQDLLSGMWVFRRGVWEELGPESPSWNLSQEIKLRAALALGERFAELPIPYASRLGDSKLSALPVGVQNLVHLLELRRELVSPLASGG